MCTTFSGTHVRTVRTGSYAPVSIYLSICLSILSINKSINKSQTPLRYLGGVKTAIKRLGTIECCLNGTAHAHAHVQDDFR